MMTPDDLTVRRQALGLSINGLGRALGMTGGAVSRWEGGQRATPPWLDLALQTLERRARMTESVHWHVRRDEVFASACCPNCGTMVLESAPGAAVVGRNPNEDSG